MSENSCKSIRNGAIASIIAGVILMAVPVLRGYAVRFFKWILSLIIWCWKALLESYALSGWAWFIIIGLAIIGFINIILSFRSEKIPEFKFYVEDIIHGAKWRWNWSRNELSDLWCYCPICDGTLVYDDSSCRSRYEPSRTEFICENCGGRVVSQIQGGNLKYALGVVEREIQRRIRTNEYKKQKHVN